MTISDKFLDKIDDIQSLKDGFPKIPINKVGVRNIKIPFTLEKKGSNELFQTVASISSYCELDANTKGINMSRISRSLNDFVPRFGKYAEVVEAVRTLKKNHESKSAWIKIKFEYVIEGKSPLTNLTSFEPVDVEMECYVDENDEIHNFMTVESTEMSLCPCSKNMSLLMNNLTDHEHKWLVSNRDNIPKSLLDKFNNAGFGAHNQKSKIKVSIKPKGDNIVWIEDVVDIIKLSSSCPTFTTIKRADEKYVTEVSYAGGYINDNGEWIMVGPYGPKFVEDIGRSVADKLIGMVDDNIIDDWTIVVDNQESIHSGDVSACAILYYNKDLKNNY